MKVNEGLFLDRKKPNGDTLMVRAMRCSAIANLAHPFACVSWATTAPR